MELFDKKHSIGKAIATLRKEKGWTQVELAEKLQVSDKAVSKWEKDDAFPSVEFFPALAELFDVSIDYLMTGKAPEKEIVFISKMEWCAQNDDISLLNGINPNAKDENGKTLADYVLQYESVNVYNTCKNLRFSTIDDIRMALLSNNIEKLTALHIKKLVHVSDRDIVPQHLRTSMPIITDDILHLIVDDPRVSNSTFDYLLEPLNDEHEYKQSSKNVWYLVIPHLINICYETNNSHKLEKLIAVATQTNEWASQQCKRDIYRSREVNLGSEYREELFGIIIIAKRTFELALNNGDIEMVEKLNKINSITLPIISENRYVANADEIRVAKLRKDINVSEDELAVQSAIHCGVLCIDEILATNDYKLIKKAIETYPVTTYELQGAVIESAIKYLSNDNWRDLFEYAVDNGDKELITFVLARDVVSCSKILNYRLEQIGNITYPEGAKNNEKYMKHREIHSFGSDYKGRIAFIAACKKQILGDCALKFEMERVTNDLDEAYFKNEILKGNFEIVIIKLCVRLEAILRGKYHYDGEFSEMLNQYCSKYGLEDDGWGYYVEADFVSYLYKLRKCRNSIVHSEKTKDTMSVDELTFCIDYICKMG